MATKTKKPKHLTKKQIRAIRDMWLDGYECGHLENDYDELKAFLKETGEFKGVLNQAADYYFELCS